MSRAAHDRTGARPDAEPDWSTLALHAARRFGLRLPARDADLAPPVPDADALDALSRLAPGSVALVVGPSGAGKSTLLRAALRAREGRHPVNASRLRLADAPAVDLAARACAASRAHDGADRAMRLLARVGLAEARVFVTPAHRLSEGERARLRLALAISRARRSGVNAVSCDEFLATLDRFTAKGVAGAVARLARERGVSLLLATSHDDLERTLRPDLVVRLSPTGRADIREAPASAPRRARIRVEPGDLADYLALAPHHYRAGRPAAIVRVLRATAPGLPTVAGALVVAMPTLNASWRRRPGEPETRAKAERARHLNASTRRIARVIVDPRCRAMGVASALVRAYLRDPLTPTTEAVASMGDLCPFFERAGMTRIALGVRPRDARLLDALHYCAVRPERLALEPRALRSLALAAPAGGPRGRRRAAFLLRELRVWAGANASTSRRKRATCAELLELASRHLHTGVIAYVHHRGSSHNRASEGGQRRR